MLTNETISEMVRLIRAKDRMCSAHEVCDGCIIKHIPNCSFNTDHKDLVKLIRIVDAWSVEHPDEEQEEEVKEVNNEQSCGNETLEGCVEHLEKCISEMNEKLTCFIHDTVDKLREIEEHAMHQDEFMQTKCVHVDSAGVESMNEPKRTNKDVLLAAFPNAKMDNNGVPYACPGQLNTHYNCDKFKICSDCRRTHWLAVVEDE